VADLGGGTFGALAILAAVLARQQTGAGQFVDTSLFGSAVAWLPTLIAGLFAEGQPPAPGEPRLAGGLAQYDVYRTADGRFISLGALEPKFWLTFLEQIGRPELAQQPTDAARAALREVFSQRTYAEWCALLGPVETCWAPVHTLDEALADPQLQALGLLQHIEHPRLGPLAQLGPPFSFSATPASLRRPPPELGQDTAALLSELGLGDADLEHLRTTGVI
jgi:crotonobetainyl-CoA:carnitine CoA-transferase CaiB-like acyl-CoA transferase